MPFYEERYSQGAQLRSTLTPSKAYQDEEPVFSAGGGYNPTNLAIRASLQEVFDAFMDPVTAELKLYATELKDDDDQ